MSERELPAITAGMQSVLDRMRDGWTLRGNSSAAFLTPPAFDGSAPVRVNRHTLRGLLERGIIEQHGESPGVATYALKEPS